MTYPPPVLPPRTDLTSRHQRVAAQAMIRGLDVFERLMSRLLVDVPPPADDPFSCTTENVEAFHPGAVLDAWRVEVRSFRRVIDADAWQVKFRTTDSSGGATSGVATVMIPRRPFNGSVRSLLSYQCAIDSLGATADPSYTLRHGDQQELPLIARALRRGWAVVTTDFTGPQHAFRRVGPRGPLRARRHPRRDRLRTGRLRYRHPDRPVGLLGRSPSNPLRSRTTPGLRAGAQHRRRRGRGAGVDLVSSPDMFEGGNLLSGIPFGGVIGMSRGFPDVDLVGVLTPHGQAMVESAGEMTVVQLMMCFPFLRWSDCLTVPGVLEIPGMRTALEATRLGQATPTTAMYLYHAVHDRYPDIADVDKLVDKYRREGVDVTYRRFRFGGHVSGAVIGVPSSLRFLAERFGGESREDASQLPRDDERAEHPPKRVHAPDHFVGTPEQPQTGDGNAHGVVDQ